MQQVLHITTKEFKDYFVSPIAYIVISLFLVVTGWLFFSAFFLFDQASLRNFFNLLPPVFSFVIPAITMRLFAEELNIGTYETLLTLPVRFRDIIIGKFLAAVGFIGIMLLPTLAYALCIASVGKLDWGPVIGGYIGAMLLGAAYTAVGLFASSLTRNQIIAFIVAVAICFALTLVDRMLFFVPQSAVSVFAYLGTGTHFQNVAKGVIDSRDLIYFLSLIFIGLYSTKIVMEQKN